MSKKKLPTDEENATPDLYGALRDSLEAVHENLKVRHMRGEASDAGTPLVNTFGLLTCALASIPEKGNSSILFAKQACESLLERASKSEENGDNGFAEVLRGHVSTLSVIVAKMLPMVENYG
jgi:hypothetical protein